MSIASAAGEDPSLFRRTLELLPAVAGKKVTLHFKGGNRPPVVGTMMKFKPKPKTAAGHEPPRLPRRPRPGVGSSSCRRPRAGRTSRRRRSRRSSPRTPATRSPAAGRGSCSRSGRRTRPRRRSRSATSRTAWPGRRATGIDITDPKTLTLEQHAVIRNELADLDGAEVRLISGFPSVQYAHVRSPLSPGTSLAGVLRANSATSRRRESRRAEQLGRHASRRRSTTAGRRSPSPRGDPDRRGRGPALPADRQADAGRGRQPRADGGEGEGRLRADRRVAGAGQPRRVRALRGRGRSEDDDAWDALKFKNPLPFPMTTAPAMVTANGPVQRPADELLGERRARRRCCGSRRR